MYSQIDSNKRKSVLLIAIFIVFIIFIGWIFAQYTEIGYFALPFAAGISIIMALSSYYGGDKVALLTSGAKEITKEQSPYVYRMVENLSIASGMPVPRVHIIQDENINAFATGRDPKHASIAVTTGAIEKLENEELEGVLAHELSHIKNYDIRVMTIVIVLVGLVAILADIFLRMTFWGGVGHSRGSKKEGTQGILMVIGLIFLIISPIIAKIIQLAVSRKREFLADASGSLMTRYPQGLANALEKIKNQNIRPMKKASNATAHLFLSSPFGSTKKFMAGMFSTHPPIDERISALRKMA